MAENIMVWKENVFQCFLRNQKHDAMERTCVFQCFLRNRKQHALEKVNVFQALFFVTNAYNVWSQHVLVGLFVRYVRNAGKVVSLIAGISSNV